MRSRSKRQSMIALAGLMPAMLLALSAVPARAQAAAATNPSRRRRGYGLKWKFQQLAILLLPLQSRKNRIARQRRLVRDKGRYFLAALSSHITIPGRSQEGGRGFSIWFSFRGCGIWLRLSI